jgi:hypothetical protein
MAPKLPHSPLLSPAAGKVRRLWERVFLSRDAMLAEYPESRDYRFLYRYHARRIAYVLRKWTPALRMMLGREWGRSLSKNTSLDDWLKAGGTQTIDHRQWTLDRRRENED